MPWSRGPAQGGWPSCACPRAHLLRITAIRFIGKSSAAILGRLPERSPTLCSLTHIPLALWLSLAHGTGGRCVGRARDVGVPVPLLPGSAMGGTVRWRCSGLGQPPRSPGREDRQWQRCHITATDQPQNLSPALSLGKQMLLWFQPYGYVQPAAGFVSPGLLAHCQAHLPTYRRGCSGATMAGRVL